MKRTLILLITLFLSISLSAQWTITGGPEGAKVNDLERVGDQIWAATEGGLYISFNEGDSWMLSEIIPFDFPVNEIASYGNEILISAEQYLPGPNDWQQFLYRSIDAGVSWSTHQIPITNSASFEASLERIDDAIFLSSDNFGLFRSDDDGVNWQEVSLPDGNIYTFAFDEANILCGSNYDDVYISSDLGNTWSLLLTVDHTNIYIDGSTVVIYSEWNGDVTVSQDLGSTWDELNDVLEGIGDELLFKKVSSGRLYAFRNNIYFSDDNGLSWTLMDADPSHRVISLIEQPNGELIIGSELGVEKTLLNGSLSQASNEGMISTEVSQIHAFPNNDLVVKTKRETFRSSNGGYTWLPVDYPNEPWSSQRYTWQNFGDSTFLVVDNELYFSDDNFITHDTLTSFSGTIGPPIVTLVNGRIYLTGQEELRYSDDMGSTWDEIIFPGSTGDCDDMFVIDENTFLVVLDDGFIFKSINAGQTWTEVLDFNAFGVDNHYFHKVGDRLVVTDGFWYSDDDGSTWTDFSANGLMQWDQNTTMNQMIAVDDLMFAAQGYHGVYISTDQGLNWQPYNTGLTKLNCVKVYHNNGILYLGMESGSIWRRVLSAQSASGMVYHDINNDGDQDVDEPPLSDVLLKTSLLEYYASSKADGSYDLFAESDADTIKVIPPTPYATVQPAFHTLDQSPVGHKFGVYFIPDMNDLCVTLTNVELFRPGFDNSLILTVKNVGTTEQAPIVKLVLPEGLTYQNASPIPDQIDMDTLIWNLPNMMPFETIDIALEVNLASTVAIGTFLEIPSFVYPITTDEDFRNNNYLLISQVVGSFDPNDKQVEPAGFFSPEQIADDEPLIYTVRFQNTGNYPAQHVRIVDTLSALLDVNSLQVLSSSHPLEWFLNEANVLEFVFEDIWLPDSVSNEPASHGFVKFSLQTKNDLVIGDVIENFADIYFDFNEPVRTNTVTTDIDEQVNVLSLVKDVERLEISPNPNSGYFYLSLPDNNSGSGQLSIYDVKGSLVQEENIVLEKDKTGILLNKPNVGIYTVVFEKENKKYLGKLIVQ